MSADKGTSRGVWRRLSARYGEGRGTHGTDMVVIRGDRWVTVYSCRRILCYSPDEICLQTANRVISVCGADLYCTSFSGGTVNVRGKILCVSYPTEDAWMPSSAADVQRGKEARK